MKIEHHVFLVAGGGSGLGAATAAMLVAQGGKVVVADVNDAGDWVARQFGAQGKFLRTDVTDETATQAAVELCVAAFGAIHGAIHCAGIAPRSASKCPSLPAWAVPRNMRPSSDTSSRTRSSTER